MEEIVSVSSDSKYFRIGGEEEEISPDDEEQLHDYFKHVVTKKYKNNSYELIYEEKI